VNTPKTFAFRLSLFLAIAAPAAALAQDAMSDICGACRAEKFASCGGFLEGATVDPVGGLWVMDLSGDRILSIGDDGQCVAKGKTGGQPNGAKFHTDGRLFIADNRQGLLVFDPKSAKVTVLLGTYDGKPLVGANDLAIDDQGGIYLTLPAGSDLMNPAGKLLYLAAGAAAPKLVSDKIGFPNGVTIGAGGQTVLVAEFAAKRVLSLPAVNAKGGFPLNYIYAATRGGVGPDGILMDKQGRLFTANLGTGEVLAFAADGRPLGSIRLPDDAGKAVTNVAVRGDFLYLTEAQKGEIWRVRLGK
jgi:gluconolactonase